MSDDRQVIDSFKGDFRFLSNFWQVPITFYDDVLGETITVRSTEHAYASQKTLDPKARREIAFADGPKETKRLGGLCALRSDWTPEVRIATMRRFLEIKFSNPMLRDLLLLTGDAELVEGNWWQDVFWGVCNGVGENNLGKLLMELRQKFAAADHI